ncbi:MAG: tRNA dihydrouridine synthase DusB [Pseudomonadota bacterium]
MTVDLSTPLHIGPLKIRNRVFLAPLSGVSDLPFRRLAWNHGAGLVVSEMIASRELCKHTPQSMQRALFVDDGAPRIVQLVGTEAHWMGEAAKMAVSLGAQMVDINMGCPAKKVIGVQSGSALMRDLDHALTLVDAVVGAVDVPVTLKMRLGWSPETMNAPELARRAVEAGVQMVTVHGRTRDQFYEGKANWAFVAGVREAIGPNTPLIINGDINSAEAAHCALVQSGADAVMVGRAACGRPWLPAQIAGHACDVPAPDEYGTYVTAHYDAILDHYGAVTGVKNARKHLGWYLDVLAPQAKPVFGPDILRERDPSVVRQQLQAAFADQSSNLDREAA